MFAIPHKFVSVQITLSFFYLLGNPILVTFRSYYHKMTGQHNGFLSITISKCWKSIIYNNLKSLWWSWLVSPEMHKASSLSFIYTLTTHSCKWNTVIACLSFSFAQYFIFFHKYGSNGFYADRTTFLSIFFAFVHPTIGAKCTVPSPLVSPTLKCSDALYAFLIFNNAAVLISYATMTEAIEVVALLQPSHLQIFMLSPL